MRIPEERIDSSVLIQNKWVSSSQKEYHQLFLRLYLPGVWFYWILSHMAEDQIQRILRIKRYIAYNAWMNEEEGT